MNNFIDNDFTDFDKEFMRIIKLFINKNEQKLWEKLRDIIDSLFLHKEICKIKQVIRNDDSLYLFYDDSKIKLIEKKLKKIYNNQEEDEGEGEPPFDLGYQEPSIYKYEFLGKTYDVISLWFDGEVDFAISAEEEINKLISLQK